MGFYFVERNMRLRLEVGVVIQNHTN
jgi:hypothetical protein